MTPFRRGVKGTISFYVPTHPGRKQLSVGTTDMDFAKRLERMVKTLADQDEWALLRALVSKPPTLTIERLWTAYRVHAIDALRAELDAVRLDTFLPGWIEDAKQRAPVSWWEQEKHVRSLLTSITYAHELIPGRIRDALNRERGAGGTKRHKLYSWSAFCRYLIAHQVLASNPCADRDAIPRPPKAKKRTEWRTADVDKAITDRIGGSNGIAALICAASGADRSTTMVLRVRDVHLLPIGTEPNKAKGIEHRIDLPGTKSETRARKGVRLEPWAVPRLREWIKGKLPDTPLVDPIGLRTISNAWREAAEAEGQGGYWLRDTRHSYGCRAILLGYTLWEVSKWLGHANPATTGDIYTQMGYEVARAIRDGISDAVTTDLTTQAKLGLLTREA